MFKEIYLFWSYYFFSTKSDSSSSIDQSVNLSPSHQIYVTCPREFARCPPCKLAPVTMIPESDKYNMQIRPFGCLFGTLGVTSVMVFTSFHIVAWCVWCIAFWWYELYVSSLSSYFLYFFFFFVPLFICLTPRRDFAMRCSVWNQHRKEAFLYPKTSGRTLNGDRMDILGWKGVVFGLSKAVLKRERETAHYY